MVLTTHRHPIGPLEDGNIIDVGGTKGLNHLSSLHLPQTMDLKAIRAHYQQLPQCHLGLTGQTEPEVPDEADGIEMREPT